VSPSPEATGDVYVQIGTTQYATNRPIDAEKVLTDDAASAQGSNALTISDAADGTPKTCSFSTKGYKPNCYQEVIVTLGDTPGLGPVGRRIFGGVVLSTEQGYTDTPGDAWYNVNVIQYAWLLTFKTVNASFTGQSGTAIAKALMDAYAPSGFTYTHVDPDLATVTLITFENVTLLQALQQLAAQLGALPPVIDDFKDLHLTMTAEAGGPDDLVPTHSSLSDVRYIEDVSQSANRIIIEGATARILAAIAGAGGETMVPLESIDDFAAAGGKARTGQQALTYGAAVAGGVGSVVGTGLVPTVAPSFVGSLGGGGQTTDGYYGYAVTFGTADGETMAGARLVIHNTAGTGVSLGTLAIGPSNVTSRKVYRTLVQTNDAAGQLAAATAALFLETTLSDNSTQTYSDLLADASLGAGAPSSNTSGLVDTSGKVTTGATSIAVLNGLTFPSSGGWVQAGSAPAFRFSGRTTSTLTGIPASGVGSIQSDIGYGNACVLCPMLTGIPVSGAGSIQNAIAQGDAMALRAQADDTARQAAIAALLPAGCDGVVELVLNAGDIPQAQADAIAAAELTLRSPAEGRLAWKSRDPKTVAGRQVRAALTQPNPVSIAGTFTIQRVQSAAFRMGGLFPTQSAEASTLQITFEQLLRRTVRP
jgi:hypothetical protein